MTADLMVFGVGSPHGEDRAGWLVVERLQEIGGPKAIAIANVSDLLHLLPNCRRAIIVDSCRRIETAPPGTITRLTWPDKAIMDQDQSSTHGIDVASALRLSEQLEILPIEVVLFGIEIASCAPEDAVCPQVAAAASDLADRIHGEWQSVEAVNHA